MHYFSPKIESRVSQIEGHGFFAVAPIAKGEVVVDFSVGPQTFINTDKAIELYDNGFDYMLQVDEDRYLQIVQDVNDPEQVQAGYINHSCEPSCGFNGALQLVAMRDIEVGDEITFDYAMSESSDYSIACRCGTPSCRGTITGDDWNIVRLQKKYAGYFSPYLAIKLHQVD